MRKERIRNRKWGLGIRNTFLVKPIFPTRPESPSWQGTRREFRAVSGTYQNPPSSNHIFKTISYSPGLLVKIGRFRTLGTSPERVFSNNPANTWKPFASMQAAFQGVWGRFRALTKIRHLQHVGRKSGPFVQNRPISNPWEFCRTIP